MRPTGPAWTTGCELPVGADFELQRDQPRPGWCQLVRNGLPVLATRDAGELLLCLDRALNAEAVAQLGRRYLLLHAGAVARNGAVVLLPAMAGSGKTTLVAGLVAAGFQYLSDEVAVVELSTGHLLPFGNCLGIKRGAHRVLRRLYPELTRGLRRRRLAGEAIWHLRPPADAWPAKPLPVRYVLLPRYVPHARPVLRQMARAEALQVALAQANAGAHGVVGLQVLVDIVRQAECYTLRCGELCRTVAMVRHLVDEADSC